MKTFFSPPAYRFDTDKIEDGFYLDVKRCPVAELMAATGASELCIQSWCGVDFGLVEIIGGSLLREGTLAMSREKCDFLFLPDTRTSAKH
jgi:ubiquinone biosynthesis protein